MLTKLKSKIEKKRNSRKIFWKFLVAGKDLLRIFLHIYNDYSDSLHPAAQKIYDVLVFPKLRKFDSLEIPDSPGEIRLFMRARNESLRLPYLLKYYSDQGVDRFFIIDNASVDETCPYVLSQKNTHVFYTSQRYSRFRNGTSWIQHLLCKYGKGYWCLVVDADEIFIYPDYEKASLKKLCSFLDREGATALENTLLDMYSDKPIRLAEYKKGDSLFSKFPFFDKQISSGIIGGKDDAGVPDMRKRVFNIDSCLNKVTLFKFSPGVFVNQGYHSIEGVSLSSIKGAVLHFAYGSYLINKSWEESEREEYFGKGTMYKVFKQKFIESKDLCLYYPGSVKMKNSSQLVDLGIMKATVEYKSFIGRHVLEGQGYPKSSSV